jgi:hypothetical protein
MMKLYDFIGVLVESVGVAIASPALLNPVSLVGVDWSFLADHARVMLWGV